MSVRKMVAEALFAASFRIKAFFSTRKARLAVILGESMNPVKLLTIVLYTLAFVAFVKNESHSEDADVAFLVSQMPLTFWLMVVAFLIAARYIGLFEHKDNKIARIVTPAVGVWFWMMIFISCLAASQFDGMSFLYIMPLTVEFFLAASAVAALRRTK